MRSTLNNLTCYDCKSCVETDGTRHGFCEVENDPVGGTDWSMEDFDKYISHIYPDYAKDCENFVPKPLFAIRGKDLLIYATCVSELSDVFASIREVWT
jgi:hypothetical protein